MEQVNICSHQRAEGVLRHMKCKMKFRKGESGKTMFHRHKALMMRQDGWKGCLWDMTDRWCLWDMTAPLINVSAPSPHTHPHFSFRIVVFSQLFSPTSQSFLFFPCQRVGSKLGLTRKLPFECPQRAKWKYKCRNTRNLGENKKSIPIAQWNILRVHWWLTKMYYSCWWKICTDTAAMRADIWNSQSSKMQMLKQSRFENKGFVWNFVCVKHISHLHHFHRKACFTFHHSFAWFSHNNNRPLFFSIEITRTNVWPHFCARGN